MPLSCIHNAGVVAVTFLTCGHAIVDHETAINRNGSGWLNEQRRQTESKKHVLLDVDVRASTSEAHGSAHARQNSSKRLVRRDVRAMNRPWGGSSHTLARPRHPGNESDSSVLAETSGEGGWFEAVVVDGTKDVNRYSWGGWSNCNTDGVKTEYYCVKAKKIKVVFSGSPKVFIYDVNPMKSLSDLFTKGGKTATSFGKDNWRAMVGNECGQDNCNAEGFNNQEGGSKCRLGMHMNQENECNSCDSSIGIGCHAHSAGLKATCCSSPNNCNRKVIATVSVQPDLPTCGQYFNDNNDLCPSDENPGKVFDEGKTETKCTSMACSVEDCCMEAPTEAPTDPPTEAPTGSESKAGEQPKLPKVVYLAIVASSVLAAKL